MNYVIQKHPGSRPQICHVDRLLKYEGETPKVWLRYDAERAEVPKEPTPVNGIQAETQNQTRQLNVMDSSVPNAGPITDGERSDMTTKQPKSFMRESSFRLRPLSKVGVRSNECERNTRKIRCTRSVAIGSSDKNGTCRQNAAESSIT